MEEESRDAEQQKASPRMSRIKLALYGALAVLILGSPLWAPLFLRRLDFFRVRKLEIDGTRYIATSDIVTRASVDTMRSRSGAAFITPPLKRSAVG